MEDKRQPHHLDPVHNTTFLDFGRRGLNHARTSEMAERKLDLLPYQLYPLIPNTLPFSDLERDVGGRRRTVNGPGKAKVTAVQAFGKAYARILWFDHLDTTFRVQVPTYTLAAQTVKYCGIN